MRSNDDLRFARRASLRLALRIARRDATAHRGRSVLIVLLIAIPIVGLSALATVMTSSTPTAAETIRDQMGNNQAMLASVSAPNPSLTQDPLNPGDWNITEAGQVDSQGNGVAATRLPTSYLPAGTRFLTLRSLAVEAKTATGIGSLSALQGEPWDPAFRGRFVVLAGHTPTTSSQVMVTPATLAQLGASIGQSVTLTEPRAGTFTIVGTMRDLTATSSARAVFARAGALDGVPLSGDISGTNFYLPKYPVSWAEVQRLNHDGVTVLSRKVLLNPPPIPPEWSDAENAFSQLQSVLILAPVVGFSLFEVALLAGAAFMVGTKQQERSLATLSSVGGDRRMLSRVVSSAGVILGFVGGAIGSALGIAAAWIYMQATSDGGVSRYPGFHVNPYVTTGIIAFAILAGWIAALVPARRAARIDVVASLRGAARPPRPSRKAPLFGILTALLGVGLTVAGVAVIETGYSATNRALLVAQLGLTLIVVGPITLQIAALIIAPSILRAVARLLSRIGTSARLASRDIARNAPRSVPAVGAIMSTIFVASFLMTYTAASQAEQTTDYEYRTAPGLVSATFEDVDPSSSQLDQIAASMRSTLHASSTVVLRNALEPGASPSASAKFAAPALNPAVRCTQLVAGPGASKPGQISIISPSCAGPDYLTDQEGGSHIWVATPSEISKAIGVPLSADSRSALASGKVVAFYSQYVRAGKVTINWWSAKQLQNLDLLDTPDGPGNPSKSVSLPAVVQLPPHPVDFDMVMLPSTARAAGIRYAPRTIVAKTPSAPTENQVDSLNATSQAVGTGPNAFFYYEGGPSVFASTAQWAILIVSALIALGAAAIALGLARAEGRRDERVLGSLGAPPPLRRSFSFWSAAVITGVGSIGGVLLGTIPAVAVSETLVQEGGRAAVPYSPPWLILALMAIGLPVLLALGSWLTAGRARVQYNVRAPIE